MHQPRMFRDDRSKKDVPGWNRLVGILEQVETQNKPSFTEKVFRQVLLEMYRRQRTLNFSYPIPPRISLESTLAVAEEFLRERSGGDRALALSGALFDAIGIHFKLFATVNRARINASDEATGQAADLECVNEQDHVVLVVEVKDRTLTLTDVEGTLQKSRQRAIKDILFTAPGVRAEDKGSVRERVSRAFTACRAESLPVRLFRSGSERSGAGRRGDSNHISAQSWRAPRQVEHAATASSGVEEALREGLNGVWKSCASSKSNPRSHTTNSSRRIKSA